MNGTTDVPVKKTYIATRVLENIMMQYCTIFPQLEYIKYWIWIKATTLTEMYEEMACIDLVYSICMYFQNNSMYPILVSMQV